jgi:hypothetical protein
VCGGAGKVWIDPNMNPEFEVIAENAEPQDKGEADRRVDEFLFRYELEERDAAYAFDRHIQRRELSPTYKQLQLGMDALRVERPLGHTLIVACYVYPLMEPCALLPNLRAELVRGMFVLQAGLADMRVPDWAIVLVAKREQAARTRRNTMAKGSGADKRKQSIRDAAIQHGFQLGVPISDLCNEYGLGRARVYEIVEGIDKTAA